MGTLHGWRGDQRLQLRQNAMVTAMEPAGETGLVLTRRDRKVLLIDTAQAKALNQAAFRFWCRSARVSPDGKQVALLHERVVVASLPQLVKLATTATGTKRAAIPCAAFVGEGTLVIGSHGGEVTVQQRQGNRFHPEAVPLVRHEKAIRGMEVVGGGSVLLTADAEGDIRFTTWPGRDTVGTIRVEGEGLTSLHVSPGGEFLAVGESDQAMSLWDLRVLTAPLLLSRPAARATPGDLAAVDLLAADERLSAAARRGLEFLRCVLQYRFRFDIEVSEAPTIQRGDFDIEIAE